MPFEDIDKKMEKWHNRIFPTITSFMIVFVFLLVMLSLILMGIHIEELANVWNSAESEAETIFSFSTFLVLIYISMLICPIYFIYTRIFTKFNFPQRDTGGGRKSKKPLKPYGV